MSFEFKVDLRNFNTRMAEYRAITGRAVPEVFRMQMRLLLKQVMTFTFPRNKPSGVKAVTRDVRRAVKPMDDEWVSKIRDGGLRNRIKTLRDKKDPALNDVLRRAKFGEVVPFTPALHKSVRNARGRVTRSSGKLTMDVAAHKAYTEKKTRLVGWARSGWNAMLGALGGAAIPSWVSRHGVAGGTVSGNPNDPVKPNISGTNSAVKIPGYQGSVDAAMRLREKKIAADIQRIIAGGATKAGFGK